MLNIIYSRSRSAVEHSLPQGKKLLMKFLKDEYGVLPLKKYTSQATPIDEKNRDENLVYLSTPCTSEGEFSRAIDAYDKSIGKSTDPIDDFLVEGKKYYIYSRVKSGSVCYYGIKAIEVKKALEDVEHHYALVCTNIKTLHEIRNDADKAGLLSKRIDRQHELFQLKAYCLVRQGAHSDNQSSVEQENRDYAAAINNIFNSFLDWIDSSPESADEKANEISRAWRELNLPREGGRPYYLPQGEDLELDFFKNVSIFDNLLIVPDCGDPSSEAGRNFYRQKVSSIVEKYMGLRRNKKKIFIIHPMSAIKFSLSSKSLNANLCAPLLSRGNVEKQFRKFISTIFKPEYDAGYTLRFAEDVQMELSRDGVSFLVPKILEELEQSEIIIADFRNYNHNCIYEAGFSYALKKQKDDRRRVYFIAPVQQRPCMNFLSFDVGGMNFHFYNLEEIIGVPSAAKNEIKKFREAFHLAAWEEISDADVRAITNCED